MRELNVILLFCYYFATNPVFGDNQKELGTSNFCEISNTNFNVAYNFTSLIDPSEDLVIKHNYPSESFRIQICTPLKKECNGKSGYGICLVQGKEERGIGKMPPKVINEPGRVLYIFNGDKCSGNSNYTVTVIMKCDHLAVDYTYPEVFPHTEEQCNLHMIWRTSLACRPQMQTDCTVVENGLHYDLSPLTKYSDNYVVQTGDGKAPKIVLNVCHSVIFEYGALCQMKSGACLRNSIGSSQEDYTNLGDVQKSPYMENEQLKITYESGAICKLQTTTQPHIKTTITFVCDLEAVDTVPEYVKGSDECHYQLVWETAAACSVESLQNHSATTAGTCSVANPLTNFVYNLQSLINKQFYATAQNGNKYTFSVCSSLMNTSCKSGSGICFTKNQTSLGKANTNLMWQEGGPFLNYTSGDVCENGQQRYTIIAFVCGAEGSPTTPIVMEEHPCQLIINWNTDLVCEKRIKCTTDDEEINLNSLIRSDNNYFVKQNGTEFQINICRPLVPVPGFTCSHGSAACLAYLSSTTEYVNETSLGFPLENPMLNDQQEIVLRYVGGSSCKEDPRKTISTNITFPCRPGNKGMLQFKKYKSCTYLFEWETPITCKAAVGVWFSPCIIRDRQGREYNLSLLHKDQSVYRVRSRHGNDYSISICQNKNYCNGSPICLGNNVYGSLANVIFYYNRNTIKLGYSNGNKCMNGTYTAEVQFICNELAGTGAPKLLWESQCSVEFEWHTNVTCSFVSSYNEPTTPTNTVEPAQRFTSGHVGIIACSAVLAVVALIGAVFYFRDPNKGTCLRSCLNSFNTKSSTGRVQYCRVNTTEEAWLLLDADPTQCQTDSDDDLLNA